MATWKCEKCGETASGPEAGVKAVIARHEAKAHPKPKVAKSAK